MFRNVVDQMEAIQHTLWSTLPTCDEVMRAVSSSQPHALPGSHNPRLPDCNNLIAVRIARCDNVGREAGREGFDNVRGA